MNEYEITYLSSGQLDEEARGQLDNTIDQLVEENDGVITHTQPNVRRRLFYPMKKQQISFARVVQATLPPDKISLVQTAIAKHNGILRVTVLKTPRRESVTLAIFDSLKPATNTPVAAAHEVAKKPSKPVSMEEVEEKIEAALDEEVK